MSWNQLRSKPLNEPLWPVTTVCPMTEQDSEMGRRQDFSYLLRQEGAIDFSPIIVEQLKWKPCLALLEMPQSPPAGSISAPEFESCSNRLDIPNRLYRHRRHAVEFHQRVRPYFFCCHIRRTDGKRVASTVMPPVQPACICCKSSRLWLSSSGTRFCSARASAE